MTKFKNISKRESKNQMEGIFENGTGKNQKEVFIQRLGKGLIWDSDLLESLKIG